MPSVDFSGESMFDNPSGTVIRRISDFNSEFGLDLGEIAAKRPARARLGARLRARSRRSRARRSSRCWCRWRKALLESDDLQSLLNTVMDMIFKYLPVERGLILLFDEDGNPVPKLTKFIEGADAQDIPISRTILKMVARAAGGADDLERARRRAAPRRQVDRHPRHPLGDVRPALEPASASSARCRSTRRSTSAASPKKISTC